MFEDIVNSISPGIGSVISGGLGFLGQMDTNAQSKSNAESANAFNANQAQINRDYQTEMSNSAYQRQVVDMEKAGLNPMLAYMKGGGASSPSGSTASATTPQYTSPIQGAAQYKLTSAQTAKTEAERPNVEAHTELTKAQTTSIIATTDKIREEIKNIPEEGRRLRAIYINLAEQSAKLAQETQSETIRQKVLTQTVLKLRNDNVITDADIKAIRDTNGIGRIAREIKPATDIGGDLISGIVDRIIGRVTTTTRETPWGNSKSTTIKK